MRLHPLLLMPLLLPGALNAANLAQEQRLSEQLVAPQLVGEARWLTAGDTRFLAIFEKTTADRRLGGVILLHDAGGHADAPAVIGPLRRQLAAWGWDSLSLQLPRPVDPLLQADREEAVELAAGRLRAAVTLFKDQGTTPLVLVGQGLGAEMALAYLADNPADEVLALAAIGLAAGTDEERDPVLRALARLRRPVLDLYGDRDRPEVLASADARRGAARRNGNPAYRQDRAMGADHDFSGLQENLQRRVAAWLRRVVTEAESAAP